MLYTIVTNGPVSRIALEEKKEQEKSHDIYNK